MLVVSAGKRKRRPLQDRFWEKVDKDGPLPEARPELGPCWLWTAYIDPTGYGKFGIEAGNVEYAHRVAFWLETGRDVPELDHLCRRRPCCRPSHLEDVTHRVNVLRGNGWPGRAHRGEPTAAMMASRSKAPACRRGHPRTTQNVHVDARGQWKCRVCERERGRRRYAAGQIAYIPAT